MGGGARFCRTEVAGALGIRRSHQQCVAGAGDVRVNQMLVQPFINYNLPDGWYLTSSPVITANWVASEDNRWTVPVGGGFGRLFKVGKFPVNAQAQAFYDALRPTGVASWTLRLQLQLLLPASTL